MARYISKYLSRNTLSILEDILLKPFCSINEHVNEDADDFGVYERLPQLLMMFDRVTVWQPVHDVIAQAHARGKFPFTPDQFLKLVEEGFIQVVGREDWFSGRVKPEGEPERILKDGELRNRWKLSTFKENFDGHLEGLRETFAHRFKDSPVIFKDLSDKEGKEWVKYNVDQNTELYRSCLEAAKKKHLPSKLRQISESGVSNEDIAKQALRESFLHTDIATRLGADLTIESPDAGAFYSQIAGAPKTLEDLKGKFSNEANLEALVDLLDRTRSVDSFNLFLDKLHALREETDVRRLIYEGLFSSGNPTLPLINDLKKQYIKYIENKGLFSYVLGEGITQKAVNIVGLLASMIGLKSVIGLEAGLSGSVSTIAGVTGSSWFPFRGYLEHRGDVRISDYKGSKFLFIARFGRDVTPNTHQLQVLRELLING